MNIKAAAARKYEKEAEYLATCCDKSILLRVIHEFSTISTHLLHELTSALNRCKSCSDERVCIDCVKADTVIEDAVLRTIIIETLRCELRKREIAK